MKAFDGRALLLLILLAAVLVWAALRRGNTTVRRGIDALDHPVDGEPREVRCPVHGHLCTAYSRAEVAREIATHDETMHEGSRR